MVDPVVGLKVLIVEDDYMVASLIERIIISARCIVSGPIPRLLEAQEAARHGNFDAAVLDINLNGKWVYPALDILSDKNIPCLFLSGYSALQLPAKYAQRPML